MNPDWHRLWPAPAKLNLFLQVIGRRDDGYHLLQTVFRFVDFCDFLRFAPAAAGEIILETPLPGVAAADDLTVRAARLLLDEAGGGHGVRIAIEKRLPMGGGLGGGSSDAATTLIALNRLWGLGLDLARLQGLGLRLGADVPVFIHGRNCFAEGVGERFTDLELPDAWYLIVIPPVSVPTATIFADPSLKRDSEPITAATWQPGVGTNDLEAVACARFPQIAAHLNWLRQWGDAHMSGSGACCFVAFSDGASAEAARAQLPAHMRGLVARGLAQHPFAS